MLKKGTRITAKLIEAIEKDQWIVSFQGNLIQVKNNTSIQFQEGLLLRLEVVRENPFQLKILSKDNSGRLKIDVVV